MPKTVGVAVSNATFHFDKLYTYAVLPEHQEMVRLGSMVLVPFGRGSRARMGVVLACDAEPENSKLKYRRGYRPGISKGRRVQCFGYYLYGFDAGESRPFIIGRCLF